MKTFEYEHFLDVRGKSGCNFVVTALPVYCLCKIEMCAVWGTFEGNA